LYVIFARECPKEWSISFLRAKPLPRAKTDPAKPVMIIEDDYILKLEFVRDYLYCNERSVGAIRRYLQSQENHMSIDEVACQLRREVEKLLPDQWSVFVSVDIADYRLLAYKGTFNTCFFSPYFDIAHPPMSANALAEYFIEALKIKQEYGR
jgi:hypothetical protein